MAINAIQFQKGLSLAQFMKEYGTEAQCEEALVAARWFSDDDLVFLVGSAHDNLQSHLGQRSLQCFGFVPYPNGDPCVMDQTPARRDGSGPA